MKKITWPLLWLLSLIFIAWLAWIGRDYYETYFSNRNKTKKAEIQKNSPIQMDSFLQKPYEETENAIEVPANLQNLEKQDLQIGTGNEATLGSKVSIHYVARLPSGKVFDSSVRRSQEFKFKIGAVEVLPGLELGVVNMKAGGTRRIFIPPHLGYGQRGAGGNLVPSNSILIYDVKLLSVEN